MREHRNGWHGGPLGMLLVAGLVAGATAAQAQDRGTCVAADVPEAFALPDGSVHDAGRITLCVHQVLNPSAGLHRVWVDGRGGTLVTSRRARPDEFTGDHAAFLFRRSPDGPIELVGYVVPYGRNAWSYALRRAEVERAAPPTSIAVRPPADDTVIVLASRAD